MDNTIKIGDFARLTGTTIKTILYYHKIGLMPEPDRTASGYRLYGADSLNRMRLIKKMKSLGLSLGQINATLGLKTDESSMREVLQLLRDATSAEIEDLQSRLSEIDLLLKDDVISLENHLTNESSFEKIMMALGENQRDFYETNCSTLFGQQRKIHDLVDNFEWGEAYQTLYENLSSAFVGDAEMYRAAIEMGKRLNGMIEGNSDEAEIKSLAFEAAAFIKNTSVLQHILCGTSPDDYPFLHLFQNVSKGAMTTVEIKFNQYLQQFLKA